MSRTIVVGRSGRLQALPRMSVARLLSFAYNIILWYSMWLGGGVAFVRGFTCMFGKDGDQALGFSESFKKCQEQPQNRPCRVEVIRRGFDGDDRVQFEKILDDPSVPHSLIVRALAVEGIKVSASTVGLHRRGACSCGIQ